MVPHSLSDLAQTREGPAPRHPGKAGSQDTMILFRLFLSVVDRHVGLLLWRRRLHGVFFFWRIASERNPLIFMATVSKRTWLTHASSEAWSEVSQLCPASRHPPGFLGSGQVGLKGPLTHEYGHDPFHLTNVVFVVDDHPTLRCQVYVFQW